MKIGVVEMDQHGPDGTLALRDERVGIALHDIVDIFAPHGRNGRVEIGGIHMDGGPEEMVGNFIPLNEQKLPGSGNLSVNLVEVLKSVLEPLLLVDSPFDTALRIESIQLIPYSPAAR